MMFRPLESYDQRVLSASLTISPDPSRLCFIHDVFGNCVGLARFAGRTRELVFESQLTLDHRPAPAFAGFDGETYTGPLPFAYSPEDMPDLARSLERLHPDPAGEVEHWARRFIRSDGRTTLPALLADMTQAIHSDFRYAKRLRGEAQTAAETLACRSGACRDFALLMMEAARSLGLAAQFVSGYIYTPTLHAGPLTRLGGGHTHAWARIYLPACGWVEFDPTNGIVGNADLVRVAIARDPRQALPLSGSWFGDSTDFLGMDVEVDVASDEDAIIPMADQLIRQPERRTGVTLAG
jgi:transglutaminase-like putative cysteine protease